MSTTPKKWSANEDEALSDMTKRGRPLAAMAERFNTTQEEVIERLKFLKDNPPGTASPKSVDITPKEEVKQSQGESMDAIDLLTNQAATAYNNLVSVLQMKAPREQVLGGAAQAEAFWRQLKGDKMPLHLFIAQVLHENYIMVPRPQILPAPSIITHVSNAKQPNSPQH